MKEMAVALWEISYQYNVYVSDLIQIIASELISCTFYVRNYIDVYFSQILMQLRTCRYIFIVTFIGWYMCLFHVFPLFYSLSPSLSLSPPSLFDCVSVYIIIYVYILCFLGRYQQCLSCHFFIALRINLLKLSLYIVFSLFHIWLCINHCNVFSSHGSLSLSLSRHTHTHTYAHSFSPSHPATQLNFTKNFYTLYIVIEQLEASC